MTANLALDYPGMPELELAGRCASGDVGAVRHLVTANNQRLFRAAWSILKNRNEAEDAVQSAYSKAFAAMASFEGRSSLKTWIFNILVNRARSRAKRGPIWRKPMRRCVAPPPRSPAPRLRGCGTSV